MALKVGNTGTLLAIQRTLDLSTRDLQDVSRRLASGLRISTPADDAAGLQLGTALQTEARLYTSAIQNVNDAISALNVAAVAVEELTSIVRRQQELAQQSANGTNSNQQRAALNEEFLALSKEYTRIIRTTSYNGMNLLQPTSSQFQVLTGISSIAQLGIDTTTGASRLAGDGTFGAVTNYPAGATPRDIVSADLNGDGIADLAIANQSSSSVDVLIGNGDGSFAAAVSYGVQTNPIALSLGDVNGDGKLDILTADYGATGQGSTASILLGNGNGTFQPFTATTIGVGPEDIQVTDVNNDGAQDIVTLQQSASFSSGTSESSLFNDASANGAIESDTVTFSAAPVQEVTSISAAATAVKEVTQITLPSGGTIAGGDYFTIHAPGQDYYVWFTTDGVGSDPLQAGTGVQVDILSTDDATAVATKVGAALGGVPDVSVSSTNAVVTVTNNTAGAVTDAADGTVGAGFAVNVTQQGADSPIAAGDYFTLNSTTTPYYVWFTVDGVGADPLLGGATGIEVDLSTGSSADAVGAAIATAIAGVGGFSASDSAGTVTVTDLVGGAAVDASNGTLGAPFNVSTTTQGVDSAIRAGSYFSVTTPGSDYYFWFRINGQGSDPALGGSIGKEIDINYGDSAATIAAAVNTAVNSTADLTGSVGGASVTITGTQYGVGVTSQGTITGLSIVNNVFGFAPNISSGQYFNLSSTTTNYYVWFNVDGAGGDPSVAGRTGIRVDISKGDSAASIASAVAAAVTATGQFTANSVGGQATITAVAVGDTTNAQNVTLSGVAVSPLVQGTNPDINLATNTISVANSYATGQKVTLLTTGTLPGPLATGTDYYIIHVDNNTVKLATSQANALSGTAIDLTTLGTGIQTITASTASGSVAYGNGDGTFTGFSPFTAGPSPQSLTIADLNNDGNGDLIITEGPSRSIQVSLGNGDGTFGTPLSLATSGDSRGLAVGDFNADGKLDLVSSNYNGSSPASLDVFFGDGDGTFQPAMAVLSGSSPNIGPFGVQAGDLTGDNIPDIIVTNFNSGTGSSVSAILSNGDGSFSAPISVTTAAGPQNVALGDFNGDGVLDFATANVNVGTVSVGLGNSAATTVEPQLDIGQQQSAVDALAVLSGVYDRLLAQQSSIATYQEVLSFELDNNATAQENVKSAASQILDADIADDAAKYVAAKIRRSAAAALLAQAEKISRESVLALLESPQQSGKVQL